MKFGFILIPLIFTTITATCQPLDIPLLLSANHAELRTNHFHSGIDIKTQGEVGKTVRTTDNGYVSRISVSPWGFGRALYIAHPNGTTTVYGHLQRFSPEIEAYVKEQQYAQKSFRVELYPPKDKFQYKKGDAVAVSGNSGSSGGPHLHFEIRDSRTQIPVNPLLAGIVSIEDTIAPVPVNVYWVALDTIEQVPSHRIAEKTSARKTSYNRYTINDNTLDITPHGYFAIEVKERKNNTHNPMGPHNIMITLDGETIFGIRLDKIPFDKSRYSNAVKLNSSNDTYRLFVMPNNELDIYGRSLNRGIISLYDTAEHQVEITIIDDCNNSSALSFNIKKGSDRHKELPAIKEGDVAIWSQQTVIKNGGLNVVIPSGALYETTRINTSSTQAQAYKYSPLYTVHTPSELLHKNISVSIDASSLPANLRTKALIGNVSSSGKRSATGGAWKQNGTTSGIVETKAGSFGKYYIAIDTTTPRIAAQFKNGENLSSKKSVSFTISDDFSGIDTYTATIDGQWALFEYDPKSNRITHYFDDKRWPKGKTHSLMLTVTDAKDNKSTLKTNYIR